MTNANSTAMRDRFSHELRTPLHQIRTSVEILTLGDSHHLTPLGRSCLDQIVAALAELDAAIERHGDWVASDRAMPLQPAGPAAI